MCEAPTAAMAPKSLELADIFQRHGAAYHDRHRPSATRQRVMAHIEACRTPALGGHVQACDHCGGRVHHYHSCRDRYCPKCQTLAKERWVEAREREILDVPHYHLVFTLPHALNPLLQGNPRQLHGLLLRAEAETLLAFGRDPRWIWAEIGVTLVLHTWGQNLGQYVHAHGLVSAGGLADDGIWKPARKRFLFPVRALSRVFRAKYLDGLARARRRGELGFAGSTAALAAADAFARFVADLKRQAWVVYAKPPFAGPAQVITYLRRYTHRVAIANDRLLALDDGKVAFRWRDYRDRANCKVMRLDVDEFIHRFLLHVLPSGFMRIRHYGLFANRHCREKLALCRRLLGQREPEARDDESVEEMMHRLTGRDINACPLCAWGRLAVVEILEPRSPARANRATGP